MIWLAPLCLAATAAAFGLAVVAHRRRLPDHRLVAAVAGVLALYLAAFVVVADRSEGVRALAALVPPAAWWAATLFVLSSGACLTVAVAQWLARATGSVRGENARMAARPAAPLDALLDEDERDDRAALFGSCLDEAAAAGMLDG